MKLWDHFELSNGWSLRVYVHPEYTHRSPEAAKQVDNHDTVVATFQPNGDLDVWSEEAPVTIPGEVMSALVRVFAEYMTRRGGE